MGTRQPVRLAPCDVEFRVFAKPLDEQCSPIGWQTYLETGDGTGSGAGLLRLVFVVRVVRGAQGLRLHRGLA